MTAKGRSDLNAVFETNDVPVQGDYVDVHDSFVNLVDTTVQAITSDITVPRIDATTVSAAILNANTINAGTIIASATATFTTDITVSGNVTLASSKTIRIPPSGLFGQAQMVAGQIIVSSDNLTVNSRVFLTIASAVGSANTSPRVSALTSGVSFVIKSNDGDTSVVNFFVIESV